MDYFIKLFEKKKFIALILSLSTNNCKVGSDVFGEHVSGTHLQRVCIAGQLYFYISKLSAVYVCLSLLLPSIS